MINLWLINKIYPGWMKIMTKEEMLEGLLAGRKLIQEEWSDKSEIQAVDELVAEGKAFATKWEYRDNFQCEMRSVVKA
jgi:hypothetical protein